MRIPIVLSALALSGAALAPPATSQEELDPRIRQEIRQIVREEIRAALREFRAGKAEAPDAKAEEKVRWVVPQKATETAHEVHFEVQGVEVGTTDEAGRFAIKGLKPGAHRIQVLKTDDGTFRIEGIEPGAFHLEDTKEDEDPIKAPVRFRRIEKKGDGFFEVVGERSDKPSATEITSEIFEDHFEKKAPSKLLQKIEAELEELDAMIEKLEAELGEKKGEWELNEAKQMLLELKPQIEASVELHGGDVVRGRVLDAEGNPVKGQVRIQKGDQILRLKGEDGQMRTLRLKHDEKGNVEVHVEADTKHKGKGHEHEAETHEHKHEKSEKVETVRIRRPKI